MSRYFSRRYRGLTAYEPGEQPQDQQYIKLNTNESPFPPSAKALEAAANAMQKLQLYPDPDFRRLAEKIAEKFSKKADEIIIGNGSDEILNFAFMAFCDEERPALFPDITYGFYPVFAQMNRIPYREIHLNDAFSINSEDYIKVGGTIFIANPNAHTGIALGMDEIERIVIGNPNNVVVIDEAYVDFGAESSTGLTDKYDNLLVIQTLSKSRSLAGARLGFAIGNRELIRDMNTLRNSINPYNINAMSMAAAVAVFEDEDYRVKNCEKIIANRRYVTEALQSLGFETTPSLGNFVFMKHPIADGEQIYGGLKSKGVLVRHFNKDRISQYNRVTIGSRVQMDIFLQKLRELLEEMKV